MRVLYLVERFWPYIGGVEVASARVLPALAQRGHKIEVLTSRDDPRLPERDEFRGIPVRRLALMQPLHDRDPESLVRIRRQMTAIEREVAPDLIHVLFTGASIYYAPAARTDGDPPMLLSFHGSWPGKATGFLSLALSSAAWVTACSQSALRDLHAMEPSIAHRSSAILNGMDPPAVRPAPLPADPPVLFCAGRVVPEKGLDLILEAFADVAGVYPAARLLIAGEGPDRPALERRAAMLGLSANVDFLGWVSPDAVPGLINGATIVVVPSRREGFGLVALEAALMSRPVVAFRVGGLPEVVDDGRTGLLAAPEDAAALAAGILRLLGDPNEGRRMGEIGRQRAISAFSGEHHANAYEQLYQRLVAEGRTVAA